MCRKRVCTVDIGAKSLLERSWGPRSEFLRVKEHTYFIAASKEALKCPQTLLSPADLSFGHFRHQRNQLTSTSKHICGTKCLCVEFYIPLLCNQNADSLLHSPFRFQTISLPNTILCQPTPTTIPQSSNFLTVSLPKAYEFENVILAYISNCSASPQSPNYKDRHFNSGSNPKSRQDLISAQSFLWQGQKHA
jgi:hypothetical protein